MSGSMPSSSQMRRSVRWLMPRSAATSLPGRSFTSAKPVCRERAKLRTRPRRRTAAQRTFLDSQLSTNATYAAPGKGDSLVPLFAAPLRNRVRTPCQELARGSRREETHRSYGPHQESPPHRRCRARHARPARLRGAGADQETLPGLTVIQPKTKTLPVRPAHRT